MGKMKDAFFESERVDRTRNPILRFIGNIAGSIMARSIVRCFDLDDKGKSYQHLGWIVDITTKIYNKWGTYYKMTNIGDNKQ